MNPNRQFEILSRDTLYQGFFSLLGIRCRHTLFKGGWSAVLQRELFQRGDCVAVIPYDPLRDEVVLIEQFRVGALRPDENPWLIEIVAGAIEEGEEADAVARRETHEEAGCEILDLRRIQDFYTSPGGSSEKITLYLAIVDCANVGGVHGLEEEHEDILVRAVPFAETMTLVEQGAVVSAIPLVGLQWLALHREGLRREAARR
ncbi:MAG TPA: NUDIX domain-containing protein [Methylococcaceae bacterium]|nr:NUDIX domain-containing protein [Methylococcaceae bacterium]